jgi:hypothetical protein
LLVDENVIPGTVAYWDATSLDMIMMEISSEQRTERQWHDLLESAGLKNPKTWSAQSDSV